MGHQIDRRTGRPCTDHNTANGPYYEGEYVVYYCSNCGGESQRTRREADD